MHVFLLDLMVHLKGESSNHLFDELHRWERLISTGMKKIEEVPSSQNKLL
jgi:hypothetical protein